MRFVIELRREMDCTNLGREFGKNPRRRRGEERNSQIYFSGFDQQRL